MYITEVPGGTDVLKNGVFLKPEVESVQKFWLALTSMNSTTTIEPPRWRVFCIEDTQQRHGHLCWPHWKTLLLLLCQIPGNYGKRVSKTVVFFPPKCMSDEWSNTRSSKAFRQGPTKATWNNLCIQPSLTANKHHQCKIGPPRFIQKNQATNAGHVKKVKTPFCGKAIYPTIYHYPTRAKALNTLLTKPTRTPNGEPTKTRPKSITLWPYFFNVLINSKTSKVQTDILQANTLIDPAKRGLKGK